MGDNKLLLATILLLGLLVPATVGADDAQGLPEFITVTLPRVDGGPSDSIVIPNGRPAYALLVSGFHQNRNFDMFHFYRFANCLLDQGAYVHYSWWNNLLAPYMERPLHDNASVPSTGPLPISDMLNLLPFPALFNKAVPVDDFQFQADALVLLAAIREHNPHAVIVLVGHSMGGDAVARLAYMADHAGIEIDLLAPIDPVGNRSCIPNFDWGGGNFCNGSFNFTRWRATHLDRINPPLLNPPRRDFSENVKYLYHRWQQEFAPPFDFTCPQGGHPILPCASLKANAEYEFIHPETLVTTIHAGSTNVQSKVATSLNSGLDVFPPPPIINSGGWIDGHGEIVGFRGVIPLTSDSYPMALEAQGNWPFGLSPVLTEVRVNHLKRWEADSNYLSDNGFEPRAPNLCMVSGDLCEILRTAVNFAPIADAGPDQVFECSDPNGMRVTLDGSASSDPNVEPLAFSWDGQFGTLLGEVISPRLPVGIHSIALTVADDKGKIATDTVMVDLRADTVPPVITDVPNAIEVSGLLGSVRIPVIYSVTATDNCGAPTLTCNPASGSLFSPGTSQVNCIAEDDYGNIDSASFSVTVNKVQASKSNDDTFLGSFSWFTFVLLLAVAVIRHTRSAATSRAPM